MKVMLIVSVIALGALGFLAASLVAAGAPLTTADVTTANEPTNDRVTTTRVFNPRGTPWGYVRGDHADGWYVGTSSECTVFEYGGTFGLSIGHTEIGAAFPSPSKQKYKVRARPAYNDWPGMPPLNGHWLRGSIVRRTATRWDFFSRTSRLVAYAIGRDGPAAGVAELVLQGNIVKGC